MKRLLLFAFSLLAPFFAFGKVTSSKPNVVIILVDDMGFSDAGCYGGEIQTPNLDKLASNGLRFTQFYNTARCWPSRAAILTGYYAQQVRRDELPILGGGSNGKRPPWAILLPQMLKPLGYRSYHSGKWHVDGPVLAGGFDHSYVIYDQNRHFNPKQHALDDKPLPPVKPNSGFYSAIAIADHAMEMLDGHKARHSDQPFFLYLAFDTPHFPIQALPEDIAIYKDRYTAGWDALRVERYERMTKMGLIHCPLSKLDPDIIPSWNLPEAKLQERIGLGEIGHALPWDQLTSEQKEFQPQKMAVHAAAIHRIDIEIGRVVEKLKEMGSFENTVIFFLSDNGASAEQMIRGDGHDRNSAPGSAKSYLCIGPGWSSAANTPFRLHKSWVHEGGITTPLIVHWPQSIAAHGELRNNPGHVVDLAPTIVQLAGGKLDTRADAQPLRSPRTLQTRAYNHSSVPQRPGKSLVPAFSKDRTVRHESLWWYHEGNRAIRMGDWKLVADHDNPWELYDLRTDRSESSNLASQYPVKVQEMERRWRDQFDLFYQQVKTENKNGR